MQTIDYTSTLIIDALYIEPGFILLAMLGLPFCICSEKLSKRGKLSDIEDSVAGPIPTPKLSFHVSWN